MPTLNWIGKEAVINHHLAVPFRLLQDVPELACGNPGGGNLIVEGDNLVALKALLPCYRGKVKCICIDPPYNTGNEGWAYNDNVNSPAIRKWIGDTVGGEGETLDRHDRWLCMMYPRLALLREFLSEDGILFVCIDDNENCYLRLLLDEIFGSSSFFAELIWKSRQHVDSRSKNGISLDHEYILAYCKTAAGFRFRGMERDESKYTNPDGDSRGDWMSRSILGLATAQQRPNLHYPLVDPKTGNEYPCPPNTGWRYSRETMAKLITEGRILFPRKVTGRPREKVFRENLQSAFMGFPSIIDGIFTDEGTVTVRDIFGEALFAFPKAQSLIATLVEQVTNPGDLVLDSFAGSGTTGHAVLKMNAAAPEAAPRRFILVEMDEKIAPGITRERVKRVAEGYTNAKGEAVPALGGGFRYVRLGEELFDGHGRINESAVRFADLARHVYFSETGEPLPKERISAKTPLLGVFHGRAVYLLYNGILKDKSVDGGNVLTRETLAHLPGHDGPKVVYAAGCRFSKARLEREGIAFKQTPYAIRTK